MPLCEVVDSALLVHQTFMPEEENPYSWIIKPFYGSETAVLSVEGVTQTIPSGL